MSDNTQEVHIGRYMVTVPVTTMKRLNESVSDLSEPPVLITEHEFKRAGIEAARQVLRCDDFGYKELTAIRFKILRLSQELIAAHLYTDIECYKKMESGEVGILAHNKYSIIRLLDHLEEAL